MIPPLISIQLILYRLPFHVTSCFSTRNEIHTSAHFFDNVEYFFFMLCNRPVADWAKANGAKQFLFISSAGIYKSSFEQPHVEGVIILSPLPIRHYTAADECVGPAFYCQITHQLLTSSILFYDVRLCNFADVSILIGHKEACIT